MSERQTLEQQFLDLVQDIFTRLDFSVELIDSAARDTGADLIVSSSSISRTAVEVKLYRSNRAPWGMLYQAAMRLQRSRHRLSTAGAILAVSSHASSIAKYNLAQLFPAVTVYDYDVLAALTALHTDLSLRLEQITGSAATFGEPIQPESASSATREEVIRTSSGQPPPPPPPAPSHQGAKLCAELRSIPVGKKGAKRFEAKMLEALQYIFKADLTAWSPQKRTENGLSYYDVVARVIAGHDFWNAMATQFASRYVVFEFKNYSARVKQGQIYTTEKYLFRAALRSTALIISQTGADKNALAAARGALRESGKLIVNLTLENVCEMLSKRDSGDDHNSVLVDLVDDMLMRLER